MVGHLACILVEYFGQNLLVLIYNCDQKLVMASGETLGSKWVLRKGHHLNPRWVQNWASIVLV